MNLPTTQPTHADIEWYAKECQILRSQASRVTTERDTAMAMVEMLKDSLNQYEKGYVETRKRLDAFEAEVNYLRTELSEANRLLRIWGPEASKNRVYS